MASQQQMVLVIIVCCNCVMIFKIIIFLIFK